MDNLLPVERHRCMSKIRSKGTTPEVLVRRILTSMNIHYRLHRKNLPGKPDIVIGRRHTVIFINGCFWHHHQGCRNAVFPKTNQGYWTEKINGNVLRQKKQIEALEKAGWHVAVLWECELKQPEMVMDIIKGILPYEQSN